MEQRFFCQASLDYVLILQEVQECKKFEFVETLLGFMYSWLNFYHQGHEIGEDCKPYMTDLQKRIQQTRENYEATRDQTSQLKDKMLESRKAKDPGSIDKIFTRQGYLFFMEKKALGSTWTKYYCTYEKRKRKFTMVGYNQISGKIFGSDDFVLKSCTRRASETIEKRFCFDIVPEDRAGVVYTLQALSEQDRRLWLEAMDGKEPTYGQPGKVYRTEETTLDDVGLSFVQKCISEIERRGLEEQGLYRLVGLTSKVSKLLNLALDRRRVESLNLADKFEWETKVITSTLKTYIRNFPEPIMTFGYHEAFIKAAKLEDRNQRISGVHRLVHGLPKQNYHLLEILFAHLKRVAAKSEKNKMTISNIGVCFGPTLLRPEEESVAGIIDTKFCNVVVEILIENYDLIFGGKPSPDDTPGEPSAASNARILTSPLKHAVVSSFNNGPKLVVLESALTASSWDSIPESGRGINQSSATVNSLQSSHSSSSNQSAGEAHSLGYLRSQCSVLERDRNTSKSNRMGRIGGFDKETSYSQPLLNSTADRAASTSSSSNESVASWPGPLGVGNCPPNPMMSGGLVQPPPYHPPPELNLTNGKDYAASTRIPKGRSTHSPFMFTCARTLYACNGEHEGELSFAPNEIITDVRQSCEAGWLEGTLRGRTGLIPENYVEPVTSLQSIQ